MVQPGRAASSSPPSHWLIFHTVDTKPFQNVWPRAWPPFGLGFRWRCRMPVSPWLPPPTAVLRCLHCPLLHSHPCQCWQMKDGPLGSWLRGGTGSMVLLQPPWRVQQWVVCQRGLEHKSQCVTPPHCHLLLRRPYDPWQGWSYWRVTQPGF